MSAQGCADLWREVLFLTISDAIHGAQHQTGMNLKNKIALTYSARDYLTKPNRDFNMICHFAGVDPAAARERLSAMIKAAASPEDLAAGKRGRAKVTRMVRNTKRRRLECNRST